MTSAGPSALGALEADEAGACTHRIHVALAPRIAVLESDDVEDVLRANNLASFADLVRPFQESVENVSVRTSQLETRQCNTFPLAFEPLDAFAPSSASSRTSADTSLFTPADLLTSQEQPQPANDHELKRKTSTQQHYARPEVLLDAISERISSKSKYLWEQRAEKRASTSSHRHHRKSSSYPNDAGIFISENFSSEKVAEDEIDMRLYRQAPIEKVTPWFADTRDMVLNARQVSYHETFGHPIAILIVVSASSPDPMNALANLYEASQAHVNSAFTKKPFVDPFVFRYYVLLHDVQKSGSDLSESVALLENVKKTYGLHCCLLPINSAGTTSHSGHPSTRSNSTSNIWQRALKTKRAKRLSSVLTGKESSGRASVEAKRNKTSIEAWNEGETSETDEMYAALIDDDDVRKIRAFVRDFAAQSLVPFMERCVSLWTEQIAASRRGLTGRLLGAGRKFFGGSSRGGTGSQQPDLFTQLGYYPHTTLESQTRRLADFAFMTRDYKLAASMYDLGRRDYANDKAYRYLAGANEMFGLSHLMNMLSSETPPIDVDSYLAAASSYYLIAPRQKGSSLQLDGLRATLLYYEAYRALRHYRNAPQALIRTASEGSSEAENDLEVVAAMLLEQAALADLRQPRKPALRKCALHLVMAAHRYRNCGQKQLSLRCFQASAYFYRILRQASASRALPLQKADDPTETTEADEDQERITEYISRTETKLGMQEWDLINDHMEQEMAEQAFNDGRMAQATAHYAAILQRQIASRETSDAESATRHEAYLQGFLTCCKYLDEDLSDVLAEHEMPTSLHLVDMENTYVEVNASTQSDDLPWQRLEKSILGKSVSSAYKTRNTTAVGEKFWVHVGVQNPFNTTLKLTDLTVELVDQASSDDEALEGLQKDKIALAELKPLEAGSFSIGVSSSAARTLRCTGFCYKLAGEVSMREEVTRRGRRLNETKEHRTAHVAMYAPCESTAVVVHESKAIIETEFVDAPLQLGLGEEVAAQIVLRNVGKAPVSDIFAHVNRPDTLISAVKQSTLNGQHESKSKLRFKDVDNSLRLQRSFAVPVSNDGRLQPGESVTWPVIVRGSALGFVTLRVLIVFRSTMSNEKLTSQLQLTMQVDPVIDLAIQAVPARTEELQYELALDAISLLPEKEGQKVVIDGLSFVGPSWVANLQKTDAINILEVFQNISREERRSSKILVKYDSTSPSESLSPPIVNLDLAVERLRSLLTGRGLTNDSLQSPTTLLRISNQVNDGWEDEISHFLFKARREYRVSTLTAEFPALANVGGENDGGHASERIEQVFPLYEPRDLDIVAHWRIVDSIGAEVSAVRTGQAFVFGLALGPLHDYLGALFKPSLSQGGGGANGHDANVSASAATSGGTTRTMYAQTEREKASIWSEIHKSRLHVDEDPIMLEFGVPEALPQHDFSFHARQTFDVGLVVRNLSPLNAYIVVLQLDNTSAPQGSAMTMPTDVFSSSSAIANKGNDQFAENETSDQRSPPPPPSLPVYASYIERLTLRVTVAPLARVVVHAKASIPKPGIVHIAPVLVQSYKMSEPLSQHQHQQQAKPDFYRWEFCMQTTKTSA